MRRLGHRMPLWFKLPAMIIVAVVLTAGASSLVAVAIGRGVLRELAISENRENLRTYADAVTLYLDNARSLLETAAARPDPTDMARAREVALRRVQHARVFEYVMFVQPDGTVALMEPQELEGSLSRKNLSYTGWFKAVISASGTLASDLQISPATQRPTAVIATPVHAADGRTVGIWAGGIRLEQLSSVGRRSGEVAMPEQFGYITDGRGLIIAHQGNPRYVEQQTDFSALPPVRAALSGQETTMQFVSAIDGVEWLGASMPLPGTAWAVVYVTSTEAAFAPVHALIRGIVLIACGITVLLGVVGVLAARRIAGTLGRLTATVQAFGQGDLNRRIDVTTGDELEILGGEFNRMAVALSQKEIQLAQRAEQLETANKELEAFSYSVSHDLRAPLRAIDGFSRILSERHAPALPSECQRYLRLVRENTYQMGQLIDDLLAFSRMSRQAVRVQWVDPTAIARSVVEQLKGDIGARRVDIRIADLPACHADPTLLRQVFTNLLANAIKFTRGREAATIEVGALTNAESGTVNGEQPDGGTRLILRNPGSTLVYFVRDNGVGFDMQYVHKLFGVFQRLHSAEEYEGTGVGLALVRRIVSRHGGRVWAEGRPERGATFYFTLCPDSTDADASMGEATPAGGVSAQRSART